ncbi:general secretion pathway protein GspB [Glaciecola sp. 1036]|uniref:general secretion pathway protein GspB n=1 Tax=Alteromonadaceae TaxID=72275 RepID=UPI003D00B621
MLKQVSVDKLAPGMMVTQVLEQHGPLKIRRVGMVKSQEMIKGLTEMGVTLVEVDMEQSLTIGLDDDEQVEQLPDKQKESLTKKLLHQNKAVEQVDRQLSQQFHNSLFMPATDEMPSHWQLYAKPVASLAAFVVLGFTLGFAVMQTPKLWQSSGNESVIVNTTEDKLQTSDSTSDQGLTAQQQPLKESEVVAQTSNDVSESTQSVQQAALQNTPELNASTENQTAKQPEQVSFINGVALADGERVLGYQSDNIETSTSQSTASHNDADSNESSSGGLNPELLRRINQAVAELDQQPLPEAQDQAGTETTSNTQVLPRIDQISPSLQNGLPSMSFSAHMYASNPQDRWVRVNGKRLEEGDYIANQVQIVEITADIVVLSYSGERFTMNALSDWQ